MYIYVAVTKMMGREGRPLSVYSGLGRKDGINAGRKDGINAAEKRGLKRRTLQGNSTEIGL